MTSKKIIVIIGFFISFFLPSVANNFEGSILITKQSLYDTTFYEFSVKENFVRLDIKNSSSQILQSLIIDLNSEKILALSPNHKLYTTLKKQNKSNYNKEDYNLIKTQNFKYIEGYKCFLWRVRNTRLNSDVTFWISEKGFDFFPKVIKLLSSTEDYTDLSNYFIQIGQDNTFFPILIVERTLLKEEKSKMTVTQIVNRPVNDKLFEIPEDYRLLRY